MKTVMDRFHDYWSGGHPDVKHLFLLSSVYPMLTLASAYVLFVKVVGPYIMRNRKPVQMRPLIVVYNLTLVIFYVWYMFRGASFIPKLGLPLFCGSLLQLDNDIVKNVFFHVYIFYLLKFVELLDTVFLVLSKKFHMATSLHVFHHAILPVFGWFGLRSESSGYLGVFIGVNSTVHVIMYTYYAIAALGPKYQKYIWWKKYLTSMQILQFLVMTIYMNFMYFFGCCASRSTFIFSQFITIVFLVMFINYYRGAFNKGENKDISRKDSFQNSKRVGNGIQISNGVQKKGDLPLKYKNATKKN